MAWVWRWVGYPQDAHRYTGQVGMVYHLKELNGSMGPYASVRFLIVEARKPPPPSARW